MAKSLGNFVTIREALQRVSPEALKLLLLSTNYRAPLDYTETAVAEKATALDGLLEFLRGVDHLLAAAPEVDAVVRLRAQGEADGSPSQAEAAFQAAMDDDFNTARAAGVLFDLVREGNRLLQQAASGGCAEAPAVVELRERAVLLRRLGAVLALNLQGSRVLTSPQSAVRITRSPAEALAELDAPFSAGSGSDERLASLVLELLAHREAARAARDWATADLIRTALGERHFRIEDSRRETRAISEFPVGWKLPPLDVAMTKA